MLLLWGSTATAQQIDVTTQQGVQHYSGATHKVVSRQDSRRVQARLNELRARLAATEQQLRETRADLLAALEDSDEIVVIREVVEVPERHPNRIQVLAGVGPDGLAIKASSAGQTIVPRYGPLLGLGYARQLDGPWSIGGQLLHGITRDRQGTTALLTGGYDF